MTKHRAIVSITFDDDDLKEFADSVGLDQSQIDVDATVHGMLDNLEFGCGWLEQLFEDGSPTIGRLSYGLLVEINTHEDAE
ncbi:MAG: hypothetical protein Q7N50_13650 [Armatimonadota bacterium]|nr:hypothetical protein [Armatimonadota bacterium]